VTECNTLAELMHEAPDRVWFERTPLAMSVHVALEVLFAEFEDQDQFLLGVDDIVESDDVGMPEFFHERDLTNRSRWGALFCIEVDLFQGDNFIVVA